MEVNRANKASSLKIFSNTSLTKRDNSSWPCWNILSGETILSIVTVNFPCVDQVLVQNAQSNRTLPLEKIHCWV